MGNGDEELTQLAIEAAKSLGDRVGIDGVVVILYRKGVNRFASAVCAPEVPIETMFAHGVKALLEIRDAVIERAEVESKQP